MPMTSKERNERMQYLNGGLASIAHKMKLSKGMVSMILSGERKDYHGVRVLFVELTDREKRRRDERAKELAAELDGE